VVTSRRAREPIVMVVVWRMVLRSCWMVMVVGVGFVGLWGDFCFFSRANHLWFTNDYGGSVVPMHHHAARITFVSTAPKRNDLGRLESSDNRRNQMQAIISL
jgi:hypothetical protein